MGKRTRDEEAHGKLERRYAAYVKARLHRAKVPSLPAASPGTAHADWSALIGHKAADLVATEVDALKREYRALKRYLKALVRAEPPARTIDDTAKPEARPELLEDVTAPARAKPAVPAKSAALARRRAAGARRISAKPAAPRTIKSRRRPETDSAE